MNDKVTGFTIKQIDADDGIDFSIEGIGQITNGKFMVLSIVALLSVLDSYSDDERDFLVHGINKILSDYDLNDFAELYCFADALGLFNDDNDDEIQN